MRANARKNDNLYFKDQIRLKAAGSEPVERVQNATLWDHYAHVTRATLARVGRAAQGPNRHDSCTQQLTSRQQGHERNLPSLAEKP